MQHARRIVVIKSRDEDAGWHRPFRRRASQYNEFDTITPDTTGSPIQHDTFCTAKREGGDSGGKLWRRVFAAVKRWLRFGLRGREY